MITTVYMLELADMTMYEASVPVLIGIYTTKEKREAAKQRWLETHNYNARYYGYDTELVENDIVLDTDSIEEDFAENVKYDTEDAWRDYNANRLPFQKRKLP